MHDLTTPTRDLTDDELSITEGGCRYPVGGDAPPLPVPLPHPLPLPRPLPVPDPVPEPFPIAILM